MGKAMHETSAKTENQCFHWIISKIARLTGTIALVFLSMVAMELPARAAPRSDIILCAFYDPEDTIILPGADGYRENYPEVSFITLVAFRKQSYGYSLYCDNYSAGAITVNIDAKLTSEFYYELVDLNQVAWHLFIGGTNEIFPDSELSYNHIDYKKGFFQMLGNDTAAQAGLLCGLNTSGDPRDSINVTLGGETNGPIAVIAVKTWNFRKDRTKLPIYLSITSTIKPEIYTGSRYIFLSGGISTGVVNVILNIDNIDFVREKFAGPSISNKPNPGDDFGPFVVKGTESLTDINERRYSNIIDLKVKEAKGLIDIRKWGGGLDWLQVAATDIYNNPPTVAAKKVFGFVSYIDADDLFLNINDYGRCLENFNMLGYYQVILNPFDRAARFNQQAMDNYGFTTTFLRDGTCFHEALHCYHDSAHKLDDNKVEADNNHVYDMEKGEYSTGDDLYVGPGGTKDSLLNFSYDSRERGFLDPDESQKLEVNRWIRGLSGDEHHNYKAQGWFIQCVYDGTGSENTLTKDQILDIFSDEHEEDQFRVIATLSTRIPDDLPYIGSPSKIKYPVIHNVFVCKRFGTIADGAEREYTSPLASLRSIVKVKRKAFTTTKLLGSYNRFQYSLVFHRYSHQDRWDIKEMDLLRKLLTKKGYKLYVLYSFEHPLSDPDSHNQIHPTEFDADYFEITHDERQ